MWFPNPKGIPSESTVEHLSNHFIMNNLPRQTWIITPTRSEEKLLGYDGGLVASKFAFIQYKRITIESYGASIELDQVQHNRLLKNFPKKDTPYVFYAFNICEANSEIGNCFRYSRSHLANGFFSKTLFFSIHAIPKFSSKTLTVRFKGTHIDTKYYSILDEWNGVTANLLLTVSA